MPMELSKIGRFAEVYTVATQLLCRSTILPSEDSPYCKASIVDGSNEWVPAYLQCLDLLDGRFVVRFRLHSSRALVRIHVTLGDEEISNSPVQFLDANPENCHCAIALNDWLSNVQCPSFKQIDNDFSNFPIINNSYYRHVIPSRFNIPGAYSLAHYAIVDNKIHKRTFGQHVGFTMFSDQILLSLARKMVLPNVEFFMNLGDWPLSETDRELLPVISWCGSNRTADIVIPTYDLTESTLHMMDRVTLDMISAAAHATPWRDKISRAIWRGRDSSKERLQLVILSKQHPDLLDARLTNMFFFPKDKELYGELVSPMSFFEFFKYKYQPGLDGTVAAYRFPYLMAGGSLILKQDSIYYEHFYAELSPWVHYVPIRVDLSDLLEKLQWAVDHDEQAREIAENARRFAIDRLLPHQVYCYHAQVLQEYSKRQSEETTILEDVEPVLQPIDNQNDCLCGRKGAENSQRKTKEISREEL